MLTLFFVADRKNPVPWWNLVISALHAASLWAVFSGQGHPYPARPVTPSPVAPPPLRRGGPGPSRHPHPLRRSQRPGAKGWGQNASGRQPPGAPPDGSRQRNRGFHAHHGARTIPGTNAPRPLPLGPDAAGHPLRDLSRNLQPWRSGGALVRIHHGPANSQAIPASTSQPSQPSFNRGVAR
jgi:hypothetical protein